MFMLHFVKFLLSKVTKLKVSSRSWGEGAITGWLPVKQPASFLGESEAFTSFTPFKETSLNSKNAYGIYQTLDFPPCLFIFTFRCKVQLIPTGHWNRV